MPHTDNNTEYYGFYNSLKNNFVLELRFEIRSLKLPLTPSFSLIHQKQQRNDEYFPLPKLLQHHNDDYDIILSN